MFVSRALVAGAVAGIALGIATAWFVPARAAAIPGLYNTGLDQNGALLAPGNGQADPHYVVVQTGLPAVTFHRPNSYAPEDADSRWISTSATGGVGFSISTYRLTFTLDPAFDPDTAEIIGKVGADNMVDISFNGIVTGQHLEGFGSLSQFVLTSGFVTGLNTIDFHVTDLGYPTAFRVDDLNGTATWSAPPVATVVEPAGWPVLLLGLIGVAGALRRGQMVRRARVVAASPTLPSGPFAADQHCPGDGLIPRAQRLRPTASPLDFPFPELHGRGWG